MSTILITGGTGMIGTRLTEILVEKGYEVIILTRKKVQLKHKSSAVRYAQWDIAKKWIDPEAFASTDVIIHLAGAGVADERWNKKRKAEIVSSRTETGDLLLHAIQHLPNKIQTVISASGIGWYGADDKHSLEQGFTEDAPADTAFLGETCKLWEHSMSAVKDFSKRLVVFRTGIVLSNTGGALVEFKKPIQLGFAAILGNGEQQISWIHIDDLTAMYLKAIEDQSMQGVYNAVAPAPVTNKVLTMALASLMRNNFFIPIHVPAFLLKWILGEMSIEILKSCKVNSFKIQSTGYHFRYPTIAEALQQLVHPS